VRPTIDDISAGEHRGAGAGDLPLAVVIPLFNEERILAENLEALARAFDGLIGADNWFFVLIDNGSTDATPRLIDRAIARWPLSQRVYLPEPNYGAALKAGLRSVTVKWAFVFDIEQWDIPFIFWAWRKRAGFDVFLASKRADPTLNHQRPYRRFLSWGFNSVLQLLFEFSGTDPHGGKLIDCQSLRTIIDVCELDRGQFDTELVLRAIRKRKRLAEAPVEYSETRPHRNLMVKKILWNVRALRRLQKMMRDVPFEGATRYHRFAREDLLAETGPVQASAREYDLV
jgi:glycosyltransferase involved in cell wall biosynthesis